MRPLFASVSGWVAQRIHGATNNGNVSPAMPFNGLAPQTVMIDIHHFISLLDKVPNIRLGQHGTDGFVRNEFCFDGVGSPYMCWSREGGGNEPHILIQLKSDVRDIQSSEDVFVTMECSPAIGSHKKGISRHYTLSEARVLMDQITAEMAQGGSLSFLKMWKKYGFPEISSVAIAGTPQPSEAPQLAEVGRIPHAERPWHRLAKRFAEHHN